MKKRLATLTMVVVLILTLTIILYACGDKGKNSGDSFTIADEYNAALIEQKLNEMKADGVYVKIKVTGESDGERVEDEFYAYGAKGDVYFFQYGDSDDQRYYDLSNENRFESYECEENTNGQLSWTKRITYYNQYLTRETLIQQVKAMTAGVWSWFGVYSNAAGTGTKSSATLLGRSCDKYVLTQGETVAFVGSASVSYEYYIDKETGVCLKFNISGSTSSIDGSASGSFGIEAVEFNTNWTPTLPLVSHTVVDSNQQGGGNTITPSGGENGTPGNGESPTDQQQTSAFVGQRFVASSVSIPQNQALESYFENAYIQLYSDLNFECISDFGCYIGHYSCYGLTSGRAVLNTMKIYADGFYDYETAESMEELEIVYENNEYILTFGIEINNQYYAVEIELENVGSVQAHDNTVCPLDPNGYGIDTVYQVSHATWNGVFQGELLFNEIGNFTVDWSVESQTYPREGRFEVDYETFNDDDIMIHVQETFEKDSSGQYRFHEYYSDGHGGWNDMGTADFDLSDWWDKYTGAIPAQFLKASYNSIGHYYYISSFTYTPLGYSSVSITDFRAWFEHNLLQRVQYTRGGETYNFVYSNYGDTEIVF